MRINPLSHGRKGPRHCANRRVPIDILDKFRQFLETLSPTRRNNYLRAEVLSKYVSSETDPPDVRRQRAINKWLAAESNNRSTNERLLSLHEDFNILPRVTWASFRAFCQEYLCRLIGEVPPHDVIFGGHGGGASTSRQRACAHPALKFVGKAHVTTDALDLALGLLVESRAWVHYGQLDVEEVPGNVMFTVPKSTDIDRCACKEPDLNMFMQRGVGSFFRKALRRAGIDLNDQSRNKDLARLGSSDGSLATLDLSSASDSITRQLVLELLPIHWFCLLDALRSKVTSIDGSEHVNEMFSSMGNGFTFELESLLFYVISRAVSYFTGTSGIISVYGDDIIVPTDIADDLQFVLGVLGFQVNPDKTFSSGSFRESCGGHYDSGCDITPFYVKRPVVHLIDLIELTNKLTKWAILPDIGILDPEVVEFIRSLRSCIPERLWGGQDFGSTLSVVTGHAPRQQLCMVTRDRSLGVGSFVLALFSGSKDQRGDVDKVPLNRYLIRRNQALVDTGYQSVLRTSW